MKLSAACVVGLLVVNPVHGICSNLDHRHRQGHVGGVLPGVTVEASSPVLIEKVRTATTDGSGQYRIVNLRAGTFTVTFSLPGFGTVKREGIELTGNFVATVNADLKVGTLEETVTVTGETPTVDVQSMRTQTVISNDAISCASSRAGLQQPHGAHAQHGDCSRFSLGCPDNARDGCIWRFRRPQQRGTSPAGRLECGLGVQRRRRVLVSPGRRERAGDLDGRVGRARRSRSRRPDDEHRAEGGREQDRGAILCREYHLGDGRQQLFAGVEGSRIDDAGRRFKRSGISTSGSAGRS